jgi:hypothetical protein
MNQENDEKPVRPFVKSVHEFQSRIRFYERTVLYMCVGAIFSGAVIFNMILNDPIVIMEKDGKKLSFSSKREEIVITEDEIKNLVENFIRRKYEWDKFSVETVMGNLSPLISSGLRGKIYEDLTKEEKNMRYEDFSQYVGRVEVTIDADNNVIGSFDKILRIHNRIKNGDGGEYLPGKIPLLSEAQIMVKVVKGFATQENPLGLYINSVVNYEPR